MTKKSTILSTQPLLTSITTPNYIEFTLSETKNRLLVPANSFVMEHIEKTNTNVLYILGDHRQFIVDETYNSVKEALEAFMEAPVYVELSKK
jgi:hypothetical protein